MTDVICIGEGERDEELILAVREEKIIQILKIFGLIKK